MEDLDKFKKVYTNKRYLYPSKDLNIINKL